MASSLKSRIQVYDFYQQQISECDQALEQQIQQFDSIGELKDLPAASCKKTQQAPAFNVREQLFQMAGVDLTQIDGINELTALKVISEVGTDMGKWRTEKPFSSWLGLAPNNKISGGKILSSKTDRVVNPAAQALRMASYTLSNSKSYLGGYYRKMRARHGSPKAITAAAHKLARLIYSMLKHGKEYVDYGEKYYEQEHRERMMKNLQRRAKEMGMVLVSDEAAAVQTTG